MDVSTFLRVHTAMAPLRDIALRNPDVDFAILCSHFLRPASNARARESIYRDVCVCIDRNISQHRIDAMILEHRRTMWARVAESNRTKKRFFYSDQALSEQALRHLWEVVDSMQTEGATIHDCALMIGIPIDSFEREQSAWRARQQIPDEEEKVSSPPQMSFSTSDIATPIASPQYSPANAASSGAASTRNTLASASERLASKRRPSISESPVSKRYRDESH